VKPQVQLRWSMQMVVEVCVLVVAQMFTPPFSSAQGDSIPAFNQIRTPVSPAFVLLGNEPTAVARPNTPASVSVSIANVNDNLKLLSRDFAVEVSPYWLFGHPMLTWQSDTSRTVGQSILRTLTVSAGNAEIGDQARSVTGIAFAVRASLISGKMSSRSQQTLRRLDSTLARDATLFNRLLADRIGDLDRRRMGELDSAGSDSGIIARIVEKYAPEESLIVMNVQREMSRKREERTKDLTEIAVEREGFFLEFAAGLLLESPDRILDSTTLRRMGVWLTPGYQWQNVSLVSVARLFADQRTSAGTAVDVGLQGVYASGSFAFSCEFVKRWFTASGGPASGTRIAGTIEYNVWTDVWLQGVFGKDFVAGAKGSLLAGLGVSFDFSKERFTVPGN